HGGARRHAVVPLAFEPVEEVLLGAALGILSPLGEEEDVHRVPVGGEHGVEPETFAAGIQLLQHLGGHRLRVAGAEVGTGPGEVVRARAGALPRNPTATTAGRGAPSTTTAATATGAGLDGKLLAGGAPLADVVAASVGLEGEEGAFGAAVGLALLADLLPGTSGGGGLADGVGDGLGEVAPARLRGLGPGGLAERDGVSVGAGALGGLGRGVRDERHGYGSVPKGSGGA